MLTKPKALNITFNNYKNRSIFIKNIKIINDGTKVYRQGKADKAGTADSAAGSTAGLEDRIKIRSLLV
mgnify:FL=1